MIDPVVVDRAELETLKALISGFYAVKGIRAWAAEENQNTKRAALETMDRLLGGGK